MAVNMGAVHVEVGTLSRTDGLCTQCYNPALVTASIHILSGMTVTRLGDITLCTDCRHDQRD